jgi:hypothetical protein
MAIVLVQWRMITVSLYTFEDLFELSAAVADPYAVQ